MNGVLDPYVVVFLTRDREGSKQKTSVQKRSLTPVWNQSLVFNDLDYNDELRVEIKANRQFQVNDFLCGFDFTVAEVMSVKDCQPSYPLVGDKVRGGGCVTVRVDSQPRAWPPPPSSTNRASQLDFR